MGIFNGQPHRAHPAAPAPQRTRTAKGERTRSRLLDSAEEVFGDTGYHAASIADITRRANVAQGTFYLYFASKLGVFIELFQQMGHDLRGKLHYATSNERSRIDAEKAGLGAFLEYASAHPRLYRIAREAEFVAPDQWYEWYDKLIEPYDRGLQQAVLNGEVRPLDTRLMAYALVGIADFVGLQLIVRQGLTAVPDGAVEALVDFIALGLAQRTDEIAIRTNIARGGARPAALRH